MTLITIQEHHVPGDDALAKWHVAQSWGYDGLELRSKGDYHFHARLPELKRARAAGAILPTVCPEMSHFIGAFDPGLRADAIAQMKSQLSVMAEIGGLGVMTPASYGMHTNRLPPFTSPRSEEEDHRVLLEGFGQLAEHALREGVEIYLEPLNRYEDHMVNRLDQGVALIREVGLPSFKLAADTYHMNIEEADPAAALVAAGEFIGHVQVSDSNRLEPGAGHVDWALTIATLKAIGYTGTLAVESRLSGPAEVVLPRVPALLRRYL